MDNNDIDLAKMFQKFSQKENLLKPNSPIIIKPPQCPSSKSSSSFIVDPIYKKLFNDLFSTWKEKDDLKILPTVSSGPGNSAIGHTAAPLVGVGAMNPGGVVYAPYIPLGTTNDNKVVYAPYIPLGTTNDNNNPAGIVDMDITVPLWLGEIRAGGFHDLVTMAYKNGSTIPTTSNNNNKKLFFALQQCLLDYSTLHKGKDISISILGDGPHPNYITEINAKFQSIFAEVNSPNQESEWTTPLRMQLLIKPEFSKYFGRMIYGGHFYATGYAEADNSPVEVATNDISKIFLEHIFWDDYRSKTAPRKIL